MKQDYNYLFQYFMLIYCLNLEFIIHDIELSFSFSCFLKQRQVFLQSGLSLGLVALQIEGNLKGSFESNFLHFPGFWTSQNFH